MPSSPASGPAAPFPTAFVVGILVVGVVSAVLTGYLGLSGVVGTGIPGTQHTTPVGPTPLASCQGKGAAGTFYFSIVAGEKNSASFNASSPGPCFAVGVGSHVTMNFSVAQGSTSFDSWAIVASSGPTGGSSPLAPALPGAGSANTNDRITGLHTGQWMVYSFTPCQVGAFRYVSEVGDRAAVGAWGPFNVTASSVTCGTAASHGSPPGVASASSVPPGLFFALGRIR